MPDAQHIPRRPPPGRAAAEIEETRGRVAAGQASPQTLSVLPGASSRSPSTQSAPDLATGGVLALQRAIGNDAVTRMLPTIQRRVDFTTKTVGDRGQLRDGIRDHLWIRADGEEDLQVSLAPQSESAVLVRGDQEGQAVTVPHRADTTDYVATVEGTAVGADPLRVKVVQGTEEATTEPFTVAAGGAGAGAPRTPLAKTTVLRTGDDPEEGMVGPLTLTTFSLPTPWLGSVEIMEAVKSEGTGRFEDSDLGERVQHDWETYTDGIADSHMTDSYDLHPGGAVPDEGGTLTTKQVHRYRRAGRTGVLPNSGFEIKRVLEVNGDASKLTTTKQGADATVGDKTSTPGEGSVQHVITWRDPNPEADQEAAADASAVADVASTAAAPAATE